MVLDLSSARSPAVTGPAALGALGPESRRSCGGLARSGVLQGESGIEKPAKIPVGRL